MGAWWRRPVSELLAKAPADLLCDIWEFHQHAMAEDARQAPPREAWMQ